ncbi:MAG: histidine kinase [Bacteroidota bacterium]
MRFATIIQRYKLYHLLLWCALLALWYFFRYDDYRDKQLAFQITLLKVVDLALMVYITNYLLIPQLLYKKKYLVFGLGFLGFVFLSSWVKMYFEGQLMENPRAFSLSHNLRGRVYDNIIPHFLLVSTGAAFKLLVDYARAQRRIGELAKENAEAELNFLKSQINPHFVFNSLNAVYFLIDKQNTNARDALHKFSDMLRYQLYECNGETTTIEKELAYVKDYIDLQKLRRNENCEVNFSTAGDLSGFTIAPLLLIPFIENAFKHLSHYREKKDFIEIRAERKDKGFIFSVKNSTEPEKKQTEVFRQGGIGLKNVQRRLELLYPGKHSLVIEPADNTFTIYLELQIV